MTLDWSLHLHSRPAGPACPQLLEPYVISASHGHAADAFPARRPVSVSGLTTSFKLFIRKKKGSPWERADTPRAMDRKQLGDLRKGTCNRLPKKSMSERD